MFNILCIIIVTLHSGNSARILAYFPIPLHSHQITYQPIWKELSLRGHQLTVITPYPLKDKSLTNLREIDISKVSLDIWNAYRISQCGMEEEMSYTNLSLFIKTTLDLIDAQFSNAEVHEIILNKNNEKFDLFLVENFPAGTFALKDVYNCPMIGISSLPFFDAQNKVVGNPNHPAVYPEHFLHFTRDLNFFERLQSGLYYLFSSYINNDFMSEIDKIVSLYFHNNTRTISELSNDFSIILANVNPLLHVTKPIVPASITFSGIHIQPAKTLPKDLKFIIDNAKEGIIYVSFGSNIKSSSMPDNKLKIFIETFSELPFKVLWKFESETILKKLPKNIIIRKWFPQQDVLNHPNLKLFITQGGLQPLDEAMYTKTPVIVIPFIGDQFGNAKKAVELKMGKTLQFAKLNKQQFTSTIMEVINNESYVKRAEEIYNILNDKPMSALETCIWWIEYILRHKDVNHLKSPMKDLPWYQFLFLDIIAFLFACVIIVTYLIIIVFKLVFYKISRKFFDKVKVN